MPLPSRGLFEFVDTPEFLDAWRAVNERPTSFAQFAQMPMPRGCQAQDLWEVASTLLRYSGTVLPFPPYFKTRGDAAWFTVPRTSQGELAELEALGRHDSPISTYIGSARDPLRLMKPLLVDEVFSLTRRDGLRLSHETVRSLWLRIREPLSPEELLVSNLSSVYDRADPLGRREITRGYIERVHDDIVTGVGALPTRPTARFPLDDLGPYRDPDYTLGVVKDLATLDPKGPIGPIYATINMSSLVWDLLPFEQADAMTEFIVRRAHLLGHGYTALAFASFSHALQKWEEGNPSFDAGFPIEEITCDSNEGLDSTIYHAVCVRALLYETGKLRSELREIQLRTAHYKEILDTKTQLNPRQKDLLVQLIVDPDSSTSIEQASAGYGVVYATARSDLLGLADRGLLTYHKQGHKFIFHGAPRLSGMLEELGGNARR